MKGSGTGKHGRLGAPLVLTECSGRAPVPSYAVTRSRRWFVALLVAFGLLVGACSSGGDDAAPETPLPEVAGVERPDDLGNEHVPLFSPVDYGTPTPSSGPHYGELATPCGAHGETPELPGVVHAQEHGVVVLWHPADADPSVRDALIVVMSEYDSQVIVAPNAGIDTVVATSWLRLLRVDDPADPRLAEFVETYRFRGLERVPCAIA